LIIRLFYEAVSTADALYLWMGYIRTTMNPWKDAVMIYCGVLPSHFLEYLQKATDNLNLYRRHPFRIRKKTSHNRSDALRL